MKRRKFGDSTLTRRKLLASGMQGLGIGALGTAFAPGGLFGRVAQAASADNGRILVVLELSGGNDGLNTVVPYGDDAYYRQRPTIGIPKNDLRLLDEHFGLSGGMVGLERLYRDGKVAIVHGCGYENPSFSHFTSMSYWHTASPNRGRRYGWVGRLADVMAPGVPDNFVVNIDSRQSLAVSAEKHVPVVFDDPERFMRETFFGQPDVFGKTPGDRTGANPSRRYLLDVAKSARDASALVREAWAGYRSPVDYGLVRLDLPKVAALIEGGMPARLYYTSYRNNAFDTHVFQPDTHRRLLTYTSDAITGFMQDLERIGRADDVTMLVFSEFGRRVPENVNLGTDHGAANVMFVIGNRVKGGHYGRIPSLAELDEGDNLPFTTDFRRVYATVIERWLEASDTRDILYGAFEPFDMFG